jgi:hypothetical protein
VVACLAPDEARIDLVLECLHARETVMRTGHLDDRGRFMFHLLLEVLVVARKQIRACHQTEAGAGYRAVHSGHDRRPHARKNGDRLVKILGRFVDQAVDPRV